MYDFVFIFLIFLEVYLTVFLIKKISVFEKRICALEISLQDASKPAIDKIRQIRKAAKNFNKVFYLLTNKKFIRIKQILTIFIETIQIIILFKSLNFKHGLKFNSAALKGLLYTQAFKKIFEKIVLIIKAYCA